MDLRGVPCMMSSLSSKEFLSVLPQGPLTASLNGAQPDVLDLPEWFGADLTFPGQWSPSQLLESLSDVVHVSYITTPAGSNRTDQWTPYVRILLDPNYLYIDPPHFSSPYAPTQTPRPPRNVATQDSAHRSRARSSITCAAL